MTNRYGKADVSNTGPTSVANMRDAAARAAYGQSWLCGVTKKLTGITLKPGVNTGSPTGTCYLEVYSGSTIGDGSLLATSQSIDISTFLAAEFTWVFTGVNMIELTATNSYWFKIVANNTINGTAYPKFYYSSTSSYADGVMSIFNGSAWSDQTWDLYFKILTNDDGGSFDIDSADTANVAALTALKAETAPHNTDTIYINSGYRVTVADGDTLNIKLIVLGDTSAGAAAAANKYGKVTFAAGSTTKFLGDATATNSGVKSSPTTPGATVSKSCEIIASGTAAKPVTFSNSTDSPDTTLRYCFNTTWGVLNFQYALATNCYGTTTSLGWPFSTLPLDSSKTTTGPIINYCTFSGLTLAASELIYAASAITIDLDCDFRYNTFDGSLMAGTGAMLVFDLNQCKLGAGVSVYMDGTTFINGQTGYTNLCRIDSGETTVKYYLNGRVSATDIRPTIVVPTNLAFTNPGTGGELTATWDNKASYVAGDKVVIYNNSGNGILAVFDATLGTGVVPGLTNGTEYTMYAKATSNNSFYSAATATATGTPTLAATYASYVTLEKSRNKTAGAANILLGCNAEMIEGATVNGALAAGAALNDLIEGTITLREAYRLLLAAQCGDITYTTATGIAVCYGAGVTTPRITAVVTDHTRDVTLLDASGSTGDGVGALVTMDTTIEGTITFSQGMRLLLAAAAGDITTNYSGTKATATIKAAGDTDTRIIADVSRHARDVTTLDATSGA